MSLLLTAILLFLLASLIVLVRAIAQAPEGYEDASGFHFTSKSEATERDSSREIDAHTFAEAPMPKHAA